MTVFFFRCSVEKNKNRPTELQASPVRIEMPARRVEKSVKEQGSTCLFRAKVTNAPTRANPFPPSLQ